MADKMPPREGEILLYTGASGAIRVEVLFEEESFWLTQKRMAELFEVTIPTINEHLRNIFSTGELDDDSVIRKFRITADDGKSYLTSFYNLDAIIAVGYRVNSRQATQFRKRAARHVIARPCLKQSQLAGRRNWRARPLRGAFSF
jgi:hypothetical protein